MNAIINNKYNFLQNNRCELESFLEEIKNEIDVNILIEFLINNDYIKIIELLLETKIKKHVINHLINPINIELLYYFCKNNKINDYKITYEII